MKELLLLMGTLLFFFYPTITILASDKQNLIERFEHPETSLIYQIHLNSGKSPKAAKEEIRKGMIESERILSMLQKRENYLEGMKVERELTLEELEKELIEEEKYCKAFIVYYDNPEKCPAYDVHISLGKAKKQAIKEIKLYYMELTKRYFESGYTWKNCLDYAKNKTEDITNKISADDTVKIEQHNKIVNSLLN